MWNSSLL
jgi:hypothetical protein